MNLLYFSLANLSFVLGMSATTLTTSEERRHILCACPGLLSVAMTKTMVRRNSWRKGYI